MNYRLLTQEEKAQNRRNRQRRNNTARREKRRAAILDSLPQPQYYVLLAAGELDREEAFQLHHGSLHKAKNLIRKVRRETEMMYLENPVLPPTPESELLDVERPTRRLAGIPPSMTLYSAPLLPVPEWPCPVDKEVSLLKTPEMRAYCRFRVLEWVNAIHETEVEIAASIAGCTLDGGPFTEDEIDRYTRAVHFRNSFQIGRYAYAVVVARDGVAHARGDWAFFEHNQLVDLPLDIHLPERLRRREYLVRLHSSEFGNPTCLDIHSMSYAPLARLEFCP